MKGIKDLLTWDQDTPMKFPEGKPITPRAALAEIANVIRSRYLQNRQQEAVDAFLRQVENFHEQLDSLQQS